MKTSSRRFALPSTVAVAAVAVASACSDRAPTAQVTQPVVYGTDDRRDVYDHPDMNLRTLAQQSIVALMRDTMLDTSEPMAVAFNSTARLRDSENLCPGQRFENDPAVAHCSGTLIDDDLVLTAGHCFTQPGTDAATPNTCQNTRFVFNYYHRAAGQLATITTQDVFSCAEIITFVDRRNADGTRQDYAFVRLDRSAAPRFTPARVARANAPARAGQSITVIGFGSGIPAKIDSGGTVTDLREADGDYFTTNFDTFQGNSGSGVFDTATRDLIGILVRGATDYVRADGGMCNVVNVCASTPGGTNCGGEAVNRLQGPFDDFCMRRPTHRFCAGGTGADAAVDATATTDAAVTTDTPAAPADVPAAPTDVAAPPADVPAAPTDVPAAPTDVPPASNDASLSVDAGTPSDRGPTADAGAPMAGGGGCSTSIPSRRGAGSLAFVALALASALRRRRR